MDTSMSAPPSRKTARSTVSSGCGTGSTTRSTPAIAAATVSARSRSTKAEPPTPSRRRTPRTTHQRASSNARTTDHEYGAVTFTGHALLGKPWLRPLLLGRSGGEGSEQAAELLHRVLVQQVSVADSRDPELGDLGVVGRPREAEDVDRARGVRDERGQGVPLPENDREHAVGPGFRVGVRAPQRFVNQVPLSSPVRLGKESGEEDVDPRVDHKPVALIGGGLANRTQPRRVFNRIAQLTGRMVGVLEVAARRPDLPQVGYKVGGLDPIAGLGVDRHGHLDGCRDAPGGSEHLVTGRPLVVLVAERGGHAAARRRDDGKAGGYHRPRRGDIPGVWKHQWGAGDVKRAEQIAATVELGRFDHPMVVYMRTRHLLPFSTRVISIKTLRSCQG